MSSIQQLATDQFASEVLESKTPVLVDFFATWCGPCRSLTPVLERFANEFAGKVKIVKVDVDAEPDLAGRYDVDNLPTLIMFKGGKIVDQMNGAPAPHQLKAMLNDQLDPKSAAAALNAPWLR